MDGDEGGLREAVEDQARARVAGDLAKFASYVTPQALLRLHRQGEPLRGGRGIKRFEVVDITVRGEAGDSSVLYSGAGSYVLRTRWERRDALWRAVMVEMPEGLSRRAWWQRLPGFGRQGTSSSGDRRDLR